MKITYNVELIPFTVPTFVNIKQSAKRRQDGFGKSFVPLEELDCETLSTLCDKFKVDVLAFAEANRLQRIRDEDPTGN